MACSGCMACPDLSGSGLLLDLHLVLWITSACPALLRVTIPTVDFNQGCWWWQFSYSPLKSRIGIVSSWKVHSVNCYWIRFCTAKLTPVLMCWVAIQSAKFCRLGVSEVNGSQSIISFINHTNYTTLVRDSRLNQPLEGCLFITIRLSMPCPDTPFLGGKIWYRYQLIVIVTFPFQK